ncbi:MAG: leucyl aminopeptidase [Deltaproteobacteria bacterium]|nr:leucyl aminopeptidase [Deltaproteobacteria bacterium]
MEFKLHTADVAALATPLLGVPVFSDDGARGAAYDEANARSGGLLGRIASEEGFKGEAGKRLLVHTPDGKAKRILLLGAGKAGSAKALDQRGLASALVKEANARKLDAAALVLDAEDAAIGAAVEGALLGAYRYDKWKTREVDGPTCTTVTLAAAGADAKALRGAVARATAVSKAVNLARDLVNDPPTLATPVRLAEVASEIAEEHGLEIEIFDRAEIQRRGMNLLDAVGAGSDVEPRFIHLTYRPKGAKTGKGGKKTPSIALVGKGITFDSGGYSLKPPASMEDMKMDMAGAAAVLGAMQAIATLGSPYVVHGIVPSAENLVNGAAYKVGDIFRSLNGKSVEVMNTDAEGRLILADALCFAERLGVDRIVDLATLTGACVIALGPNTAGLFSNDEAFGGRVRAAADAAGESVWPMPLEKKLESMLKTPNADIKNVGQRWGGAITAALFLKEFVGDVTWCHLDIAGPAYADKADSYVPKGGTGFAVMTLIELARGEI